VYARDLSGFPTTNITAAGGVGALGGLDGGAGTVYILQAQARMHVQLHAPAGLPNVGFVGRGNGYVDHAIDAITLTFNKAIDTTTFGSSVFEISGQMGRISPTGISEISDRTYRIALPFPLSENGPYHFRLLPTVKDVEGFFLDQNANGISGEPADEYAFDLFLDTVPPRITNHTPAGDITGTVDHVDVWFSERIDKTTFTTSDVVITRPDSQTVAATSIQEVGFNRFRLNFAPQTLAGTYHVKIGPDIGDLAGNKLDQDRDVMQGEPVDDEYDAAFNLVSLDLAVSDLSISVPELVAGTSASIAWRGRNATGAPLLGNWSDGVYLSADDRWDIGDTRLATVPHAGGLAQDESYDASTSVMIPGVLPRSYYLIVRADVFNQQGEMVVDKGNNVRALGPLPLIVTPLAPSGPAANGQLTRIDPADFYAISLAAGETLKLRMDANPTTTRTELYVSYAAIPTRLRYDERAATPGQVKEVALTGIAGGGTYYVLVYADQPPNDVTYSIVAEVAPLFITGISPRHHGNGAPATVTITGAGFDENTTVEFVQGKDRRPVTVQYVSPSTLILPSVDDLATGVYAIEVRRGTSTASFANAFEVVAGGEARVEARLIVPRSLNPGFPVKQTLWIEYRNAGDVAIPAPMLQVTADSLGLLTADERQAESLRGQRRPIPNGLGSSVQILATGSGATPGLLQPGDSFRIPVYYVGLEQDKGQGSVRFSLGILTAADTTERVCYTGNPAQRVVFERPGHGRRNIDVNAPLPLLGTGRNCFEEFLTIDWNSLRDSRPASIAVDAWDAILLNLRAEYGDLWADYVAEMSQNASVLGTVGQTTTEIADLWGFEIAQASASLNPVRYLAGAVDAAIPAPGLPLTFSRVYGNTLASRFQIGPLGRGWTHNWDIRAVTQTNGDVILHGPGGVDRFFTRNGNGTFTASPGDYGRLVRTGQSLKLTETDGTVWDFGASEQLQSVRDTNGNQITLGYSFGRLASLTHSNGRQLLLEYNHADFGTAYLTRLTDTMGAGAVNDRIVQYEYDFSPDGPYLQRVVAPGNRITQYDYNPLNLVSFKPTGPRGDTNPANLVPDPRSHALVEVTYPDATHDLFAYDSQGRLVETKKDGDAERVVFRYRDEGHAQVEDSTGRVTNLYFGLGGQLAQVRDGDGRIVGFGYDREFQFGGLNGPGGERYRYGYDAKGNLTSIRDALNLETTFKYEPTFNQLASFTDARGNGIDYQYDMRGNLTAIVYADATRETFTYDALGNVLTATNRRGQTVSYEYNAAGQVTEKDYDTTPGVVDFVYAYDTAGNLISATDAHGTTGMSYDSATDLLTRIDYPDGKFFAFAYDAVGRRTRRTDQDGNAVNYAYDSIGRLDVMTSAVTGLPTESLIVDYDYDAAGRLARKTLGNGVYSTYEYDDAGQLIHLVNYKPAVAGLPTEPLSRFDYTYDMSGRRTSMTTNEGTYGYAYDALGQLVGVVHPDGRVVNYDYDEAGNRRQVIDDGVTTAYTTNDLNQYLTVGDFEYEYDLDGNLTKKLSTLDPQLSTLYTYDIENRLVRVERGSDVWEYEYDALGNRIASTQNGATTQYVIDPTGLRNVAAEYDGSAGLIARYEHGYGLLSRTDVAGDPAYYTFSAIGNTSELTGTGGAVLNEYAYDPFGESLTKNETVASPFEFVGEYGVMNEGNGLEFMRARFFDAGLGRFVSEDPIGLYGNQTNYNVYSYNDPIHYVDPDGLASTTDDVARKARDTTARRLGRRIAEGILRKQFGRRVVPPGIGEVIGGLKLGPDLYKIQLQEREKWRNYCEQVGDELGLDQCDALRQQPGVSPNAPTTQRQSNRSDIPRSGDPNDKLFPSGFGDAQFIQSDESLAYTIRFENMPEATAPAQLIVITDTLDADLDLDTFELTEIGFADQQVTVPLGLDHYETTVPIQANGSDILVEVRAALDRQTRVFTLTLQAIDPNTGWMPDDPLTGLLYPNDDTARGEGFVSYVVRAQPALLSGTQITNRANIIFDYNDPILTPLVTNTIDAGPPTSQIDCGTDCQTIQEATTFTINWSGADDADGSGVAMYNVYASINGGPFAMIAQGTTETSLDIEGVLGGSYAFYTMATDNVGRVEAKPPAADTTFKILAPLSLEAGPDQTTSEGEAFALATASFALDDDPGLLSGMVDWGDGMTEPLVLAPGTGGGSFANTHVYADDGAYQVKLTLSDTFGRMREDALNVQVNNTPPTLALSGFETSDEGSVYTLTLGAVTDPGTDSVTQYVVHWGDGTTKSYDSPGAVTHTYLDDMANATIRVDLVDEDGTHTSAAGKSLTVRNVAPAIAIDGGAETSEGSMFELMLGAVSDPGTDTVTQYFVDWGDGTSDSYSAAGAVTHTYLDDMANATIRVDLVDEDGTHTGAAGKSLKILNVAPTLMLHGAADVDEGSVYTLTLGAVADPGTDRVESYIVHWGDGTQATVTAAELAASAGALLHVYPKGVGAQAIAVDVVDEDGTHANAGGRSVMVDNVAPTLADRALAIAENQPPGTEVGTITASDASASPVFAYAIDSGNVGGAFEIDNSGKIRVANAAALNHEQLAQVLLRVTVTDDGVPAKSATATITIDVNDVNEAPTAVSVTPAMADENLSGLTIGSLAAADEDAGDTHQFSTDDPRFEVVGGKLKLKEGVSLDLDDGPTVSVQVTARDAGTPALEATRTLVINVAPNPFPWQNRRAPLDTTNDGFISPLDVLVGINLLILPATPLLSTTNQLPRSRPAATDLAYFDVNADGYATAVDVLNVVNFLIEPGHGEGEPTELARQAPSVALPPQPKFVAPTDTTATVLPLIRPQAHEIVWQSLAADEFLPDLDWTRGKSSDGSPLEDALADWLDELAADLKLALNGVEVD